MKNKYQNLLIVILLLFIFFEVLFNKLIVLNTIMESLNIWVKAIIPSLFPFFVISDLLISYNFINYIPKCIKNCLCKLFNISDSALSILLLSMLSGFPSNGRNTHILYNEGRISKEEASYILMYTHFASPVFILTTCSLLYLKSEKLGIVLLLSHYLANIIIAILFKNMNKPSVDNSIIVITKSQNFTSNLIKSIRKAIDTLLLILGILTTFLIISSLIINILKTSLYSSAIIRSILEMTLGLKYISILNISTLHKVILFSAILSFGGLSVHMQVISQIAEDNISYKYFFIGRIFQVLFSIILSYIFYNLFFISLAATKPVAAAVTILPAFPAPSPIK